MRDALGTYTPGTFEHIEQKIRLDAVRTEFGAEFERLCQYFLRNAPKYKQILKSVWLWDDWPGRWGADKGIDLVAETQDGTLWAIQAKAVHHDRAIPKSELDSFLSESNRPQFDYRLIIATTDDIGRNARDKGRLERRHFGGHVAFSWVKELREGIGDPSFGPTRSKSG